MIERGECGASDGVVLVVVVVKRVRVRERTCARVGHGREGRKRRPLALRGNRRV